MLLHYRKFKISNNMENTKKQMKQLAYNKKTEYSGVLCLGFFDCVHMGHVKLIEKAREFHENVFVFTFNNDLTPFLHGKNGYIYSFAERLTRLSEEGVFGVVEARFDDNFMKLSRETFLDGLIGTLNITRIVCGKDYTFGKMASGDTDFLIEYFKSRKIAVDVFDLVQIDGVKASTSYAKELLISGEIEKLNKLLVKPYRVSGTVVKGNQIGSKIGFPTANIEVMPLQTRIKQGVYAGFATVQGKKFRAIINAGNRPTLNSDEFKIETYIDGSFGELYGENIVVEFIFKIRDIIKFDTLEKLQEQLKKDIRAIDDLQFDEANLSRNQKE